MRWLIVFAAVFVGCIASIPADPTLSADLAVETARMISILRQGLPPTPVSNECSNCNGTGKIGDGRIVMTCPECRGTGKTAKSVCVEGCKP
jgi:RecJ-like exonuclease